MAPPRFESILPDPSWSFAGCSARETGYITHCYHRYPAKFIPQVAARLIREHSEPGDVVLDPFMGSGTTLVEAVVQGRRARGVDINPAAVIAARAKTTPISPVVLRAALTDFEERVSWLARDHLGGMLFLSPPRPLLPGDRERLDWWFPRDQQRRLGIILATIETVEDMPIRRFLRCAFSHVLKSASYWLMKSSKPTRDRTKLARGVPNPIRPLLRHLRKMERANAEFWRLAPDRLRAKPQAAADARCGDARSLPWKAGSAALVVTSPPYVTSYEYADLHELTTLWLGSLPGIGPPPPPLPPTSPLPAAPPLPEGEGRRRKQAFIGSAAARARSGTEADSALGRRIVAELRPRSESKADEVRQYFLDMQDAFREMGRVLRPGGRLCNVIGNTVLEGVPILNAQVHAEILETLGFTLVDVVRRVIPLKTLPQVRDPETGRFTSDKSAAVHAYPEEFILIARR